LTPAFALGLPARRSARATLAPIETTRF
jgi:hypothetical protein